MGGHGRGMKKKEMQQIARKKREVGIDELREMGIDELFDWMVSGEGMEEDGDLYNTCTFLIRAVNSKIIPTTTTTTTTTTETSIFSQPRCHQEDFHHINLVTKYNNPYFPSILNCVGNGTMLSFHSRQACQVYILEEPSEELVKHTHDVDNPIHEHTDASVISATQVGDWAPFVHPDTHQKVDTLLLNPAVLSDQIYSFGFPNLSLRVCNPNTSTHWDRITLPEDLVDTNVSFPLISDPLNDRIILNLPLKSMLYAFYPTAGKSGNWEPLARFVRKWDYSAAAITDNIIFFLPADVYGIHNIILAFDLKTSTWLDIEWDFEKIRGIVIVYQAIFTLSDNGLMCLATGIRGSSVQFLRFRFKHTSDTCLKLTAIDYHSYDLPGATSISDIIFLRNPGE